MFVTNIQAECVCCFFQTASLAAHHLNGTVTEKCVVDLHVIQILIGICVYPHYDFIPLVILQL